VVHTFLDPPPPADPLPALGLTNDVAVLTALSNDVGFEVVFSRQIAAFGRQGDIAVALSTSGGSANVLAALEEADRAGMVTVGLAGYGGGRMADLPALRYLFAIPSSSVHRVQEVQTTLYHVLWEATQAALADTRGRPPRGPGGDPFRLPPGNHGTSRTDHGSAPGQTARITGAPGRPAAGPRRPPPAPG